MFKFDAVTALTAQYQPDEIAHAIFDHFRHGDACLKEMKGGRGSRFFGHRISIKTHDGGEFAAISHGGTHESLVMLEAKGCFTGEVISFIRDQFPEHEYSRLDSCADFDEEGGFERFDKELEIIKKNSRLKGSKAGDWDDFPEDGRTRYLGAPSADMRVRLYEKGKMPECRALKRPHWFRLEAQLRLDKEIRKYVPLISPSDVWKFSPWTREVVAAVLDQHLDPIRARSAKVSVRDRALQHMAKQYGKHLSSLADELGSWQAVGLTIADLIAESRGQS